MRLRKTKKIAARNLKSQQREAESLTEKIKQPVSLNVAFLFVEDVPPNIETCYNYFKSV